MKVKLSKPVEDRADTKVLDAFADLAELKFQVQELRNVVNVQRELSLDKVFDQSSVWYQQLREHVCRDIVSFLGASHMWEIMEVRIEDSPQRRVSDLRKFYADGWRYVNAIYDKGTRVEIYHRPRLPETKEEFAEIYRIFYKRLKRDMNFQAEVKAPRSPDKRVSLKK